ncbi:MAG: hypothetical protein JXL84_07120 [Deltaproteobacteria bacterium]|nr:hypothetical protein [Deltaproteobacteria bacterium]
MKYIKKLIFWGCIAGVVYFFLSIHIIFIGSKPHLLKKTKLSADYTFFSTQGKNNESILSVDELRKAGIGQILVQTGRITEEQLEALTTKIEEAKEEGS